MSNCILWLAAAIGLLMLVLLVIVTWAIWRMTIAHERIEQHVLAIERHLAAQRQG